jgi:hypothetical protein
MPIRFTGREARYIYEASVEMQMFLLAAGDYGTKHGATAHYGTATKQSPYWRRQMRLSDWVNLDMVTPNTKWSRGPATWRALTRSDRGPGWVLPRTWVVMDCDESKGRHRTRDEIIEELPDGIFCMVPSTTPGNWHVWYLLHEPIWDSQEKLMKPHYALWGADTNYSSNTLAHNPVRRSLVPQPHGAVTWWNPCLADGEFPFVRLEDLRHPEGDTQVQSAPREIRVVPELSGRVDLGELVEHMADMREGDGRMHHLYLYIQKVGCARRRALGRDLTFEEVMQIGREANSIFVVPKSPEQVEYQVRYFLNREPWSLQAWRAENANLRQHDEAVERFFEVLDQLELLKDLNHQAVPMVTPDTSLFSDEELARADTYAGRRGTTSHLAYVLGVEVKSIRNILERGRTKGYLRSEIPYRVLAA